MAEYLFQKPVQLSSYNVLDIALKQQEAQQKLMADVLKDQSKKSRSIDNSLMKELNSLNSSHMYDPDKQAMQMYQQELDNVLFNEDVTNPAVQRYFGTLLNNAVQHMEIAKEAYKAGEFAYEEDPQRLSFSNILNMQQRGLNPWADDGLEPEINIEDITNQRSRRNTMQDMFIDKSTGMVVVNTDNGNYNRIEDPLFEDPSYDLNLVDMSSMLPSDYAKDKKSSYSNIETEEQVRAILTSEIENNSGLARRAALSKIDRSFLQNAEAVENALKEWIDETVDLLFKVEEPSAAEGKRDNEREVLLEGTTLPEFEDIAVGPTSGDDEGDKFVSNDYEMAYAPVDLRVNISDNERVVQNALINYLVFDNDLNLVVVYSPAYNVSGYSESKTMSFDVNNKQYTTIKNAINAKYGKGTFEEMLAKAMNP